MPFLSSALKSGRKKASCTLYHNMRFPPLCPSRRFSLRRGEKVSQKGPQRRMPHTGMDMRGAGLPRQGLPPYPMPEKPLPALCPPFFPSPEGPGEPVPFRPQRPSQRVHPPAARRRPPLPADTKKAAGRAFLKKSRPAAWAGHRQKKPVPPEEARAFVFTRPCRRPAFR